MTKRLTIDRGNTALKAAIWDGCGHLEKVFSLPAHSCISDITGTFDVSGLSAVGYSSVVKDACRPDLEILRALGCPVYDVKGDIALPFVNAYGTPDTLGADRIAALAGAIELVGGSGALVADLGTAATFDLLESTPDGPLYRGGNISPGVPLRLRSLHEHTSALPDVSPDLVPDSIWGHSTVSALLNGAVCGMLAELEFYRSHTPEGCATVLTGGGADYLVKNNLITFKHIHDPHLVLRGLNSIINYNENR